MESARGRAFLTKFAMRSRAADTANLLTAIGRIESLLVTRSLEPAEDSSEEVSPADSSEPLSDPDGGLEAPDIEAAAADILEIDPAADLLEAESLSASEAACEDVTERAAEIEATPAAERVNATPVATDHYAAGIVMSYASAIEFLGPDIVAGATTPDQAAPQAARAEHAPRDPFADICALSEEEKLALFA